MLAIKANIEYYQIVCYLNRITEHNKDIHYYLYNRKNYYYFFQRGLAECLYEILTLLF